MVGVCWTFISDVIQWEPFQGKIKLIVYVELNYMSGAKTEDIQWEMG